MVALESLDETDKVTLKAMIEKHEAATGSAKASIVLINWKVYADRFVKVMPMDYKRVLQALERAKAAGLSGDEAMAAAFEENAHATGH
jgi:glutamate synthase (ferredoxin)